MNSPAESRDDFFELALNQPAFRRLYSDHASSQSIPATPYGIDNAAAGTALQAALGKRLDADGVQVREIHGSGRRAPIA
jgi:hypothetical protein